MFIPPVNTRALEQRTLVSGCNPRYVSADKLQIELDATFEEMLSFGPIPFVAHRDDGEVHGREIFYRAAQGEFGEVAPFSPA